MNPRIAKLREEHEKIKTKISELQARDREILKQLRELENTEIIGLVRAQGLKLENFAALMRGAGMPVPQTTITDKEDEHESED